MTMTSMTLTGGFKEEKKMSKLKKKITIVLFAVFALTISFAITGFAAKAKADTKAATCPTSGVFEINDKVGLKLNEDGGMRWILKMDKAHFSYIKGNEAVELGFVIAPKILMDQANGKYYDMQKKIVVRVNKDKIYELTDKDGYHYANGCVINMKAVNRKYDYTAAAYIKNGEKIEKQAAVNENSVKSFYNVSNAAILYSGEDYSEKMLGLTAYDWLGTEEYPIKVDTIEQYNSLVGKINAGRDFSSKYIAVNTSVNEEEGAVLEEGKSLPQNKYRAGTVIFKDGDKELGSVLVKEGAAASFASPEKAPDETYRYSFAKWVTENGGDMEADLNNVTHDMTVYADFNKIYLNDITELVANDVEYEVTPDIKATAKHGEIQLTYSKTKDGEYVAWDKLDNHNVGVYYVKAFVAATSEMDGAEQFASFNVTKATNSITLEIATIKCTDDPIPTVNAKHGKAKFLYGKDIDTVQAWEFSVVKLKDAEGNEIIDAKLGYRVKATIEETENYEGATAVADFTVAHDFDENGLCKYCNKPQSCVSYAEDGNVAYISGYIEGFNPSGEVHPLAKYNNKPVTYVAKDCPWTGMVKKIILPQSVTDFKGNSFERAANLEYISMTGVTHISTGNNFINNQKITTVIVNKAFKLDNQQFKMHKINVDPTVVIYVDGSKNESTFAFNKNAGNEFLTGIVYYKVADNRNPKCLEWRFDENGNLLRGSGEHNFVDGKCTICDAYNAAGVVYGYDGISKSYYVAGCESSLTEVIVLDKFNDGEHGEAAVTFVKFGAFMNNAVIKKVILGKNITTLDGCVFLNCPNLEYVSMEGVEELKKTTLGESNRGSVYGFNDFTWRNFEDCTKLTAIVVGKKFTVGAKMFHGDAMGTVKIYTTAANAEEFTLTIDRSDAGNNNNLLSDSVYYFSKTEASGAWHYVNGAPTLWV